MKIHEFLIKAREDAGYERKTACELSGISYSTVSGWELGIKQPNIALLNDYLDFLGVTLTLGRGGDYE